MSAFAHFGGVDFSGAREPLSTLWSAVGEERGGKLHVLAVSPHAYRTDLARFVGGGWRALVGSCGTTPILWGAAFPFGLPYGAAASIGGDGSWGALVEWVAERGQEEVRETLAGAARSLRRTDSSAGAPAPLDLRLWKQTVEGLRWIAQLRADANVSVLPFETHRPGHDALVEVYPAATARDLGFKWGKLPRKPGESRARAAALRSYLTFEHPTLEQTAITLEDAWDAVLACYTAWCVRDALDQPRSAPGSGWEREGWIYRVPAALG